MTTMQTTLEKEHSIFSVYGNKLVTPDKIVNVVAKYEEPLVVVLDSVLTDEECQALIEISKERLQRSKIGHTREVSEQRTSSGAFLERSEHEVITRIEKRLAALSGIPLQNAEELHILNYKPGQEYKEHFDYFTATSKAAENNRIATFVLYLNDVEEGGETYFPKLNLSVYPKKGGAVYFEYFYTNDDTNALTLHGGAPVLEGEKWIATQWIRRKPIDR